MLPVVIFIVGEPKNLIGGRFTTGSFLSSSILSFVNRTTGCWYAPSFTNSECDDKDTFSDSLSTSFFLHNSVALLYCDNISHSHIILADWCNVINWYWNNPARHLCIKWGTFPSDLNIFSPLKLDIAVNSVTKKFFINFLMAHFTADASPAKVYLELYSVDTIDLQMKEIGRRRIFRDLSSSHFLPDFSCTSDFLASAESSACRITTSIQLLDQSVLM